MRRAVFILALILPAALAAQADLSSSAYGFFLNLFYPSLDPFAGETVFPILDTPAGGYAEGMASSLTALPAESSAILYNPASSSVLEETELSIYHSNWIGDSKIESVAYAMRFDDLGLGAAGKWLYAGFKEYNDFGEALAKANFSEAMVALNMSYNFFSGYYFAGLALGASLKAAYRSVPDYADDEGRLIPGSGAGQSAVALMADVGFLVRFNALKFYAGRSKNMAIGLALRNLGPAVLGEALPTALSLGAAYTPVKPLTISADLTKPLDLVNPAASEGMQYALAADARILDFFSVHAGFQLRNGPRLSAGAAVDLADVTIIVNYTLDLATQLQDANRLSIEARIDLGDGGRYALRLKVEEFYLRGVEEYAMGNIQTAADLWEQALKLDPGFDPARQSRATALKALELKRQLDEIQSLGG
jgi:hypothetical protein